MSSLPETRQFPPGRSSRPRAPAPVTVLMAAATVYLISNHWLHILDALPYLGGVLMMGMRLLMYGGHSGHGGQGGAGPGPDGEGAGHVH